MPLVQPLTINSLIRANIIGHGVQMLGEPSILLRCDRYVTRPGAGCVSQLCARDLLAVCREMCLRTTNVGALAWLLIRVGAEAHTFVPQSFLSFFHRSYSTSVLSEG
jgi:hypothetical protein